MSEIKLGNLEFLDYRNFICGLMTLTKPKICVEIGVSKGQTTVFMAKTLSALHGPGAAVIHGFDNWSNHGLRGQYGASATKEKVEEYFDSLQVSNVVLHEVDLINDHDEFKKILNQITNNGKDFIDFAFIDACHSYVGAKKDFDAVYPLLNPEGGTIVFHDTLMIDGCRELMLDLRTKYYDGTYDVIDFVGGSTFATRNIGVSILTKRGFPVTNRAIEQVCGSISKPEIIEGNERLWLASEIKKYKDKKTHLDYDYNAEDMDNCLSDKKSKNYRKKRKRGVKWPE